MKIRFIYTIIFLLIATFLKAQSLVVGKAIKSYQIKTGIDRSGDISLTEKENRIFTGYIKYEFYKGKIASEKGFVGRLFHNDNKERKIDSVFIKNQLPDSVAKVLMLKLEQIGIEKLIRCEFDLECEKYQFIDPSFTVFDLNLQGDIKNFEYQSIGYPSTKYPEKTKLRKNVQTLVNICMNEINFTKQFEVARKKLKNGWYYMYGNVGYITFRIIK